MARFNRNRNRSNEPDDLNEDPFGEDPFAARDAAPPPAPQPRGRNPFEPEPVLGGDSNEQNTPNTYNVRNILFIAGAGMVLVLLAFLFTVGGEEEQTATLEPEEDAVVSAATPPVLPETLPPPDENLNALLGEPPPQTAYAPAGGYAAPPPEPAPAEPAAPEAPVDRPPTYLELRREAFLAAMGLGTRRSVNEPGAQAPQEAAGFAEDGTPLAADGTPLPAQVGPDGLIQPVSTNPGTAGAQPGATRPVASSGVARPTGRPGTRGRASAFHQASQQSNAPFTPFTLALGTIIPVVLETDVSSDHEGVMIARTTEDIYDRTRRYVLIPRGSQVVSTYSEAEVNGSRLEAAANRINLPDGRSVDLQNAALHDTRGRRGLSDQVRRHTLSRVGAGALLTVAGVAAGVTGRRAQRGGVVVVQNADGSISQLPIRDEIENEATAQGAQGAQRALDRRAEATINRPNTILLRSGLRGNVVLQQDIDMVQPYYQGDQNRPAGMGRSPFDTRAQFDRPAGLRRANVAPRPQPAPAPRSGQTQTRTASAVRER